MLPLIVDTAYQPPLALLLSRTDKPSDAVFYPFAEFSPEWNAIQYALTHAVPVRFCDWPAAAGLAYSAAKISAESVRAELVEAHALRQAQGERSADDFESSKVEADEVADERLDPIAQLATAAGESDPEAWWDSLIEQQPNDLAVFDAISEAMAAGRAAH